MHLAAQQPAIRTPTVDCASGSSGTSPSIGNMSLAYRCNNAMHQVSKTQRQLVRPRLGQQHAVRSFKVEIEHQGNTVTLDMPEGQSILEVALDKGIDLPHDCKLGVCMTCPAKLISGEVDQSGSMLSDDVAEKGYALLCMAIPKSDCKIVTVSEEELLDEQLCA